jgi:hypothetical protein
MRDKITYNSVWVVFEEYHFYNEEILNMMLGCLLRGSFIYISFIAVM